MRLSERSRLVIAQSEMLEVFARFKSRKEENGIPKDSQKGAQPKEIKSKNFNLNCLEMNL